MNKEFLKKMKEYLLEQRKTLLASLADQSEDMRSLVKTVESGDEADVAADVGHVFHYGFGHTWRFREGSGCLVETDASARE